MYTHTPVTLIYIYIYIFSLSLSLAACAYELGPYSHFASEEGVNVLFCGEISTWPDLSVDPVADAQNAYIFGNKSLNEAERLVKYYRALLDVPNRDEMMERALESLSRLEGNFSVIIFDATMKRVLAARDRHGGQPLHWGVADDGLLCFSTDPAFLSECARPTAAPFPAGCLYASGGNLMASHPGVGAEGWVMEGDQWPGRVVSFLQDERTHYWKRVQAVPRVDSHGVLCGNVFRVQSDRDLADRRRGKKGY